MRLPSLSLVLWVLSTSVLMSINLFLIECLLHRCLQSMYDFYLNWCQVHLLGCQHIQFQCGWLCFCYLLVSGTYSLHWEPSYRMRLSSFSLLNPLLGLLWFSFIAPLPHTPRPQYLCLLTANVLVQHICLLLSCLLAHIFGWWFLCLPYPDHIP